MYVCEGIDTLEVHIFVHNGYVREVGSMVQADSGHFGAGLLTYDAHRPPPVPPTLQPMTSPTPPPSSLFILSLFSDLTDGGELTILATNDRTPRRAHTHTHIHTLTSYHEGSIWEQTKSLVRLSPLSKSFLPVDEPFASWGGKQTCTCTLDYKFVCLTHVN